MYFMFVVVLSSHALGKYNFFAIHQNKHCDKGGGESAQHDITKRKLLTQLDKELC